jgi:hypothetical protein
MDEDGTENNFGIKAAGLRVVSYSKGKRECQ